MKNYRVTTWERGGAAPILRVGDDSLGDYENAFSGPSVSRT